MTVRGDNTPPLYRIDDDDDNDNDVAAEVVDLDFGEDLPGLNAGDFLTDDQFRAMFPQCTRPDRERDAVETQYTIAEAYNRNGEIWRSGTTVELRDGDFMKIIDVLEGSNNEIFLRGRRFRRTSRLRGLLDQHLNELLMLVEYTEHTPLEDIPPAADVQTIPASDAIKTRDLILTNETYPTYSYKEDRRNRGLPRAIAREECRLICRWKILLKYRKKGVRKVWAERCLARLRSEEADYGWRSRDNNLRAEWRGETIRRGSCLSWLAGEKAFDVAEQSRNRGVDILGFRRQSASSIQQLNGQRYTFGDAFCGAGGMSRGAKGAGLRVVWGVDFDPAAIDSYSKNFFEAKCEAAPADVFAMSIDGDYLVDILHLSPPCQPFSPIHTREGKDDEMNSSSLFAVGELLRKTKPRIATLENTFGLVERWEPWLNALVRVFTALGFSVRWRVLDLAAYGVPQARRRLILIASW